MNAMLITFRTDENGESYISWFDVQEIIKETKCFITTEEGYKFNKNRCGKLVKSDNADFRMFVDTDCTVESLYGYLEEYPVRLEKGTGYVETIEDMICLVKCKSNKATQEVVEEVVEVEEVEEAEEPVVEVESTQEVEISKEARKNAQLVLLFMVAYLQCVALNFIDSLTEEQKNSRSTIKFNNRNQELGIRISISYRRGYKPYFEWISIACLDELGCVIRESSLCGYLVHIEDIVDFRVKEPPTEVQELASQYLAVTRALQRVMQIAGIKSIETANGTVYADDVQYVLDNIERSYIDEFAEKSARNILRYGDIVYDKEYKNESNYIRDRMVIYEHNEYFIRMINGNITRFEIQNGYFLSEVSKQ